MSALLKTFQLLDVDAKKKVHIKAGHHALTIWGEFCQENPHLSYTESVVGTHHDVDKKLPHNALAAVVNASNENHIEHLYREPICALQDMDWELPWHIKQAYYAIYNLFQKYCLQSEIDEEIIIYQSIGLEQSDVGFDVRLADFLSEVS